MIRAWWAHQQALDGSQAGASAAQVLERTGWQRSLGGVGPYVSLFARAGLSRQAVEDAVAAGEIREIPSARSCMYVVPAAHYALALRLRQAGGEPEIAGAKKHFDVTDAEIDRLCEAVLSALDAGPLDTRGLKSAVGGSVRDFGPEGQRRGVTSTLPLALGKLEGAGEIRRVAHEGRLDEKRYAYTRWRDNPLTSVKLTDEEAHTELARQYFRWIGPARLAHFQWFSGLSAKAARAAIAPLDLVPVESGDERMMFPEDREALHAFQTPDEPHIVLTTNFDNVIHLRRDVSEVLGDVTDLQRLYGEQGTQQAGGLTDLQSHPILDRGRLIGLWEYDVQPATIVWATLDPPGPEVAAAVARMEGYVRGKLGECRSFGMDRPESRKPRIAALREMAAIVAS